MSDLIIALAEEIGDPEFFMGRKAEMEFYLSWAENTKRLHSKSQALLSRRKKGKTALVQRLFNILYSNNDPQIIPFFFRVPEMKMSTSDFGHTFYQTFLSQYLSFRLRRPELANEVMGLKELKALSDDCPEVKQDILTMEDKASISPGLVWGHAQATPHRLATKHDFRVMQIIDEFQYMNRFVYTEDMKNQVDLCHSYMGLAESKYAPLLVTGSYIGWLTTILNHMTARFEPARLNSLTRDEALAAVYNYATIMKREVNEDTAPYIAQVAYNDPFYISQIIRTNMPNPDLTTRKGVRAALQFETTFPGGYTAHVWMEYIAEGLHRVNDRNGKAIVLYLAKYGDQERTREEITRDLKLDIPDHVLADRLYMLKQADLIAPGSSEFRFKGLGDPIFEVIFRKRYAEEIERVTAQEVEAQFDEAMKQKKREAWHKGLAGEYKVMYLLMSAVHRGVKAEDVFLNPQEDFTLEGFEKMEKKSFHWDQANHCTVDLYAENSRGNPDLIAEVKTWDKPVSADQVAPFIELKQTLTLQLERKTAFLFYSENGFTEGAEQKLLEHGVMYADHGKLTSSRNL